MAPMPPNPTIIIAQEAGSGIAVSAKDSVPLKDPLPPLLPFTTRVCVPLVTGKSRMNPFSTWPVGPSEKGWPLNVTDEKSMLLNKLPTQFVVIVAPVALGSVFLAPVLAQLSINVGWGILLTAALSFIGAGVRAPTPEWGSMIAMGFQNVVTGQWWPSMFPGAMLAITVFGFSLVGTSIEVLADPAKRRQLLNEARQRPAGRAAAASKRQSLEQV